MRQRGPADLLSQARAAIPKPEHTEVTPEAGAREIRVGTQFRGERMLLDHSQGLRRTGTRPK